MAKEKNEQKPETMEEFYKKIVDRQSAQLDAMLERNHDLAMNYADMAMKIKEIRSMTQRTLGINPETEESDERALDERLEAINNDLVFTNGILSHIYRGRVVSIRQRANRGITFYFGNHNLQLQDKSYTATQVTLSEESFVLILEAMEFAAKKFGTDRKQMAKNLTGTDEPIEFKNVISHL